MVHFLRRQITFSALSVTVASASVLAALSTIGWAENTGEGEQPAAKSSLGQPTDEDYVRFAESMEKNAKSGDIAAVNRLIDWDAILSRATTPLEGSKAFADQFVLRTKQDVAGEYGIAAKISKLIRGGSDFRCLRVQVQDGEKRLVFRLLNAKRMSLDYFEFVLSRRADGAVVASDYYTFRTGDTMSQATRRRYRSLAPVFTKVIAREKLSPEDLAYLENDRKFHQMQACSSAGDGRRALEIYAQLPDSWRTEKLVLLTRIEAANHLRGQPYDEAMKALESALPADPCLDFVLLDYFFANQQYDKAREAIDRVDARIGGDPYQDARRALCCMQQKKYRQAREYAQKAIKAEDSLLLAYGVLLQVALDEKAFDEVSRLLILIEEKSLMVLPDLSTTPAYAEFVKSPQYQTWRKNAKPK